MENTADLVQTAETIKIQQNKEVSKLSVGYSAKIVSDEEMASHSSETQSATEEEEMTLDEKEEFLSQKWKKPSGSNFSLVQEMMETGLSPSQVLRSLVGTDCNITDDIMAFKLLVQFLGERRYRHRLPQFNDFTHAVELFRNAKKVLIITGAGVSVNCGIPDFRSSKGIYANLKKTFPDLPHPTAMFDIDFFKAKPEPFFSFAKEIFPGMYKPSVSHMFIKFLEDEGKLLRNYTQNIDTLERISGIRNYIECHGSFGSATCLECGHKYTSDDIREDIYAQKVARCKLCETGLIKPDIVFFGENLPDHFHLQMSKDKSLVDLVVVIGSSLQVQPVSLVPFNIEEDIPQILINKEDLSSYNADIKLIGDCDSIIVSLCMAIGGKFKELMLKELKSRSSDILAELEPLLSSNSDGFLPKVISADEIKEQMEMVEEVPAKRIKLDEEEVSDAEDKLDELRQMYDAKYTHVPSKFNGYSYAKFPPNLNIFEGADFYYNTDQQTFGPLPRRQQTSDDSEDEDGQNSDSSSSDSTRYCDSAPELRRNSNEGNLGRRDTESCPPFDSDSSSPNSPSSN